APDAVKCARPQPALGVLVEIERPEAGPTVATEALREGTLQLAQDPPRRRVGDHRPHDARAILEHLSNLTSAELVVARQRAVFPACQSVVRTDPERAVTAGHQTEHATDSEWRARWRQPQHGPDAVEAVQADV